ncbi:bifunctional 5,10-methylene-tetrahydrofolate dehydrogenase 5,10-methylene-tetrahydrofolate cyclohydrolase [Amylolactobacillus amylotrophicus DSM 20534]|uniref:Bifunctional protein FolD n=3 Tax=Amylolactobacillus TaxID=2767876 RepID=A0A0R1YKH5_9LACO|nr:MULTISPECIES: tetrahydrofolate dehydrogenase/cyclohydrolase catalytic domain-containing protein [Amylolactobacillus]APT17938.1 bifunctional methylenetetrahydrofolate dehydrogenase/methenyltetrahydrofolate cyclohydrolase [Amylolactobacillus amylophilus DSM 20533 = JCM 1125]KRK38351.1 bifunctional 5,10-methylene-tetrahydrofolate dehydrogenase 5,10-methylene-tetrahydrofolate cyclohydrolase [Amylolactobacillus amylotrophicus DSM 20534]KRM43006.1 bifunctional 5,10-methylene-tetrahydrofolate dehydr
MNNLIDGKAIANELAVSLRQSVAELKRSGVQPKLAVILVGDNSASAIYVRNKGRRAEELGISFRLIHLPATVNEAELLRNIEQLNQDSGVDGILVQLPLPAAINEETVINAIAPEKDVDGFSPVNFGHLWQNNPAIIPSTAGGIMTLLKAKNIDLTGQNVVIINRSNIVGRPLAALMLQQDATVTIAHSKTKNLPELTRTADILVSATGRAAFVTKDMVHPGAIVIDVGMNRDEAGKLVGDVDFAAVSKKAGLITPVPGGVGPMTVITLMQQVVEIAKKRKD